MNLIDKIDEKITVDESFCKLVGLQNNLDKIEPPEVREAILELSKRKQTSHKILSVVLNSIFTDMKGTFLMSQKILRNLISNCTFIKRTTLSGANWKVFRENEFSRLFKQIRPFKTFKTDGINTPAVYTWKDGDLKDYFTKQMGENLFELQQTKVLEWWQTQTPELIKQIKIENKKQGDFKKTPEIKEKLKERGIKI